MSKYDKLENLLENTFPVGDCRKWAGYLSSKGYPQTTIRGKSFRVHRLVASMYHNIPYEDSKQVRHLCSNAWCINPEHLVFGTAFENNHDRIYTVDVEVWEDIASMIRLGMTHYQIADLYGISRSTVGKGLKRYYERRDH